MKGEGFLPHALRSSPLFLRQGGTDGLQHPFHVLHHIAVPEAKHPDSLSRQRLAPGGVVFGLALFRMAAAVQLHHQLFFMTIKIQNERPDWMLAAESASQLLAAQMRPKPLLGFGRLVAQLPRTGESFLRKGRFPGNRSTPPSFGLRFPLPNPPPKGEGAFGRRFPPSLREGVGGRENLPGLSPSPCPLPEGEGKTLSDPLSLRSPAHHPERSELSAFTPHSRRFHLFHIYFCFTHETIHDIGRHLNRDAAPLSTSLNVEAQETRPFHVIRIQGDCEFLLELFL